MATADRILEETDMNGVELLVLPEMVFSGISSIFCTFISVSMRLRLSCQFLLYIHHEDCNT